MSTAIYYDAFRERLLEDYEIRNRRVVAALEFAKDSLVGTTTLLDVGCGIGWTSAEMADTGKAVTGVDVSPVLIETAKEMFGDRCLFVAGDFAYGNLGRFDAVLMIDVYEHFPREHHHLVHHRLRDAATSRVMLTMPTPKTQQYARDNGIPLQPVDEDITDEDIERLAQGVDGQVLVNKLVSIWRDDDYRHVLIKRP